MPEFDRALVWLRRDLRLYDHRALFEACTLAREVVPVFIYDTVILDALEDKDDRRVTFIHAAMDEIESELEKRHKGLVTLIGDPVDFIPRLVRELGADAVFCAHDDDPYALRRDKAVAKELGSSGFHSVKDHVIFERREVLNGSGEPFRIFTPYAKAWRSKLVLERDAAEFEPDLSKLVEVGDLPPGLLGNRSFEEIGFTENRAMFAPGEKAARERLVEFLDHISDYAESRNLVSEDGTSSLSTHLRFGTISIRECVRAAARRSSQGAQKWLGELIWREFYQMILANFAQIGEGKCFNSVYDRIDWPGSEEHFQAWCEGRTGYPLVDAAMRCFRATGWMHNRNRMVVASFLVKDLLVDWRRGEEWFARFLLDFELASNNGNWQWAAGTGVDAQPYFRIFNPVTQSRKFDPRGEFIRTWCPELADLKDREIHEPWKISEMERIAAGVYYPERIVLHEEQRRTAIRLFEEARRRGE